MAGRPSHKSRIAPDWDGRTPFKEAITPVVEDKPARKPGTGRSPEAQAWQPWYKTYRWWKLRRAVRARDGGLCQECRRHGRVTEGNVVHHIVAHKGNEALFYDAENCELVCKPCHDSDLQAEEKGSHASIPLDGYAKHWR